MTTSNQCTGTINSEGDTWITLTLSLVVLPLCAFFLVDTWKRWLTTHRRSGPATATSSGQKASGSSPSQTRHAQSSTTESTSHGQQSIHTHRNATSSSMAVQQSWVDVGRYWAKKMFRPRGLNQLLGNLLLASWTILAFDQLFHALFIVSITFTCPAYNCRHYQSFATPGCPAGLFEGLQLIIQPFGSCCFIVATVNRFVNVYSQLSRRRYIALRVATFIVCLVCTCMSIVTTYAFVIMSSPTNGGPVASLARQYLLLGDFFTYLSIGIISILALMMGLDYVIKTRKAAGVLRHQPKLHSQAATSVSTGQSHSSSADSSPTAASLQPSTQKRAAGTDHGSSLPPGKSSIWQRIWADERRKSVTTVICIFINISIIIMFLAEHPFIKERAPSDAGAAAKSALLDSAVMSLSHKLFCAMVTIAIHQMTNLVLSRN